MHHKGFPLIPVIITIFAAIVVGGYFVMTQWAGGPISGTKLAVYSGGVRTDIPNNTPKFFQIQTEMESLVETANDTLLLAVLASDVAKIKKDEAVAIRVLPDQTKIRSIIHSTIPRFVNHLTLGIESHLESKNSLTPRTKYLLCV